MSGRHVRWAVAALVLTTSACHHTAAQSVVPSDLVISLERTVCYGQCPSYVVALRADGTVRFSGRRFTRFIGDTVEHVAPDSVAAIERALQQVGFTTLPENLTYGSPACPTRIADLPTAVITRWAGGKETHVLHQAGCQGAPPELQAIELRIDALARTARWTAER